MRMGSLNRVLAPGPSAAVALRFVCKRNSFGAALGRINLLFAAVPAGGPPVIHFMPDSFLFSRTNDTPSLSFRA